MIHHMDTRKIRIKTTKKYLLQIQLIYICYYHLNMHKQVRNVVLDLHKDQFAHQSMSIIVKSLKVPMSMMLSLKMIYK